MLKIILPAFIALTVWGFVYYNFILDRQKPEQSPVNQNAESEDNPSNNSAQEVPRTIPKSSATPLPADSSLAAKINELSQKISQLGFLENKVSNVEKTTEDLKNRVAKLESSSNTSQGNTITTQTNKSPQYIYSLGSGGSTSSTDWQEITSLTIIVDPLLYSGYSNMQLEALIRVKDGNGKAFTRLYSSGTALPESELSTDSYKDVWVISGTFNAGSKKSYTIQVKSLTGYEAFVSDVRVKVNY
jgi:hypothetical protein